MRKAPCGSHVQKPADVGSSQQVSMIESRWSQLAPRWDLIRVRTQTKRGRPKRSRTEEPSQTNVPPEPLSITLQKRKYAWRKAKRMRPDG